MKLILRVSSSNEYCDGGCEFALIDLTKELASLALRRIKALKVHKKVDEQTRLLIDAMHRLPRSGTHSPEARAQIMPDFRAYHSVPRILGIPRNWVFAAVGVTAVAALAVVIWIVRMRTEQPATIQATTLDLTDRGPVRGPEEEPPKPPLELPRAKLELTIYLPFGSEPGTYDLQIVRQRGQPPLWIAERGARLENHKTTVHADIDTSRWKRGEYSLGVSAKGWSWTYFPLVLK